MPINQLFRTIPDRAFTIELLNLYGIDDFTDTHFFTKNDLDKLETIHKLNEIIDRLDEYYIPCKSKTYLQDITIKRSIVILRHFLKCHNYNIHSKEKFIKGVVVECVLMFGPSCRINADVPSVTTPRSAI